MSKRGTAPEVAIFDPPPDEGMLPSSIAGEAAPDLGELAESSPEPARKRRKRRTKAEMAAERGTGAPEPAIVDPEAIAALSGACGLGFRIAGNIIARGRGEHWKLSEDEIAQLGAAWGVALAPYAGTFAKYAPLAAAALVTFEVVQPRLALDRVQEGQRRTAAAIEAERGGPDV